MGLVLRATQYPATYEGGGVQSVVPVVLVGNKIKICMLE